MSKYTLLFFIDFPNESLQIAHAHLGFLWFFFYFHFRCNITPLLKRNYFPLLNSKRKQLLVSEADFNFQILELVKQCF